MSYNAAVVGICADGFPDCNSAGHTVVTRLISRHRAITVWSVHHVSEVIDLDVNRGQVQLIARWDDKQALPPAFL